MHTNRKSHATRKYACAQSQNKSSSAIHHDDKQQYVTNIGKKFSSRQEYELEINENRVIQLTRNIKATVAINFNHCCQDIIIFHKMLGKAGI